MAAIDEDDDALTAGGADDGGAPDVDEAADEVGDVDDDEDEEDMLESSAGGIARLLRLSSSSASLCISLYVATIASCNSYSKTLSATHKMYTMLAARPSVVRGLIIPTSSSSSIHTRTGSLRSIASNSSTARIQQAAGGN